MMIDFQASAPWLVLFADIWSMKNDEDDKIYVKLEIVEFEPNFNWYQLMMVSYCKFFFLFTLGFYVGVRLGYCLPNKYFGL